MIWRKAMNFYMKMKIKRSCASNVLNSATTHWQRSFATLNRKSAGFTICYVTLSRSPAHFPEPCLVCLNFWKSPCLSDWPMKTRKRYRTGYTLLPTMPSRKFGRNARGQSTTSSGMTSAYPLPGNILVHGCVTDNLFHILCDCCFRQHETVSFRDIDRNNSHIFRTDCPDTYSHSLCILL